jgi:cellulose synthase/poly-beta-1,6-N-acetylglucosamine synthase-like glycosyltransferase
LARGSILFFIDADVLVHPDTLSKVAAIMRSDDSIAACFGSYDDAPVATNFLSQYRNLQHHYVHQTSSSEASTFWAGCGAIRRHTFLEMGGFSTAYSRPSIEDIELGYRLRADGYRIYLDRTLIVSHMKQWTARSVIVTDIRDRAIPWARLILQAKGVLNDLNLDMTQRISTLTVFVGIATLFAGLFFPWALLLTGLAVVIVLALNWDFYSFLNDKRGTGFTLLALPWHWLYFTYSGVSFGICLIWYRFLGFNNPTSEIEQARLMPLESTDARPTGASTDTGNR